MTYDAVVKYSVAVCDDRRVGDLGSIQADGSEFELHHAMVARLVASLEDKWMSLEGTNSVVGRTLVVR